MTDTLLLKITLSILLLCGSAAASAQYSTADADNRDAYGTNPFPDGSSPSPQMAFGGDIPATLDVSLGWDRGITYSPLGLAVERFGADTPDFVRLGGGLPGQSAAAVNCGYGVTKHATVGLWGIHAGTYGNAESDLGVTRNQNSTRNRIGLFWQSGREVKFDAWLDYRHDVWTRYGQFVYGDATPVVERITKQNYSAPTLRFRLGHDFTDLSELNFAVSADGYYIEDGYHNRESGGSFSIDLAQMIDAWNGLALQVNFDGTAGDQRLMDYDNVTFRLSPAYLAKPIRNLDVVLGGHLIFDMRKAFTSISMFMPRVRVSYAVGGDRKIFAEMDGRLLRNNFRRLTEQNPYVRVDSILPLNTRRTELRVGIEGKMWDGRIAYKVYGGGNSSKHAVVFANSYAAGRTSTFRPLREALLTEYFGGLKLRSQVTERLTAEMAAHVYFHKTKTFAHANGLPQNDFEVLAHYAVMSRFTVYSGLTLLGTRYFAEYQEPEEYDAGNGNTWMIGGLTRFRKEGPAADLRLGVGYRVNSRIRAFLEGHNLLGQKLYNFYHYPDRGATINFGVTAGI